MTTNNIRRYLSLTNVLIVICVLLFGALVGALMKLYHQDGPFAKVIDEVLNAPVIYKVDNQGRTHAHKPAVELDATTAEVVNKRMFDSVCAALDIKSKQIEDLRAIGSITTDIIVPQSELKTGTDSGCHIFYSDQWFTLDGRVCSVKDSVRYAYIDSFYITRYWARDKFLGMGIGKKHSYLDAYSLNRKTVVKGLTGVDITDNLFDRLRLSGYAGYRSMYQLQSFNAGLEVEVFLNRRTSLELNGEYYLHSGQLRPLISGKAKFSLLKF